MGAGVRMCGCVYVCVYVHRVQVRRCVGAKVRRCEGRIYTIGSIGWMRDNLGLLHCNNARYNVKRWIPVGMREQSEQRGTPSDFFLFCKGACCVACARVWDVEVVFKSPSIFVYVIYVPFS